MTIDGLIFIVSAGVAVFAATMVIAQRNAVASVLYMIVSLVAQAVCYVQLGALFLGAILVVVYGGAIMVLFLFVIMLLNLRSAEQDEEARPTVGKFTKYLVGLLLTLELLLVVKGGVFQSIFTGPLPEAVADFGSIRTVAKTMFTDYLYPLELTGVLLLVAVVGAVVVAKTEREGDSDRPQASDESELK